MKILKALTYNSEKIKSSQVFLVYLVQLLWLTILSSHAVGWCKRALSRYKILRLHRLFDQDQRQQYSVFPSGMDINLLFAVVCSSKGSINVLELISLIRNLANEFYKSPFKPTSEINTKWLNRKYNIKSLCHKYKIY